MKFAFLISCVFGFWLAPPGAHATLGEPLPTGAATAEANTGSLPTAGTAKVTSQKATSAAELYSSSESTVDGNIIKQYSNAAGIVFAVSWTGISKPDLAALFGTYFKEYSDASDSIPKQTGVRSLAFKTSKMVVRRSGRMRDQHGLAYVPSLVPAGVVVEELP